MISIKLRNSMLYLAVVSTIFVSCKSEKEKEQVTPSLTIPSAYDSSAYVTNVTDYSGIRTNMDALVAEIKKGRVTSTPVLSANLVSAYTAGTVSLQSITTGYYKQLLTGSIGWFEEAVKASGHTYHPDSAQAGQGGVFGGYMFDEHGFEPEQMIEKGLFGAALSNKAMDLISNSPSLANVDQALYIFGATPHFVSSNAAKHGSAADKYLASYTARRDKNDGNGFYSQMKYNFIKLQAAVKAGNEFKKERDEAAAAIKLAWEKANFSTVINYCYASISKLTATSMTDADKASTMHALGECVGFVHGWRTISSNHKKITDAQIDEILELLNAPVNGSGKPSKFITDRNNEVAKLQTVITKLQQIYGFTAAELEDFKKNWVSEQNR